jgi:hypothetical protein
MKLGAYARETKPFDFKIFNKENHTPLKKRLSAFKTYFKKVNREFGDFEAHWLS